MSHITVTKMSLKTSLSEAEILKGLQSKGIAFLDLAGTDASTSITIDSADKDTIAVSNGPHMEKIYEQLCSHNIAVLDLTGIGRWVKVLGHKGAKHVTKKENGTLIISDSTGRILFEAEKDDDFRPLVMVPKCFRHYEKLPMELRKQILRNAGDDHYQHIVAVEQQYYFPGNTSVMLGQSGTPFQPTDRFLSVYHMSGARCPPLLLVSKSMRDDVELSGIYAHIQISGVSGGASFNRHSDTLETMLHPADFNKPPRMPLSRFLPGNSTSLSKVQIMAMPIHMFMANPAWTIDTLRSFKDLKNLRLSGRALASINLDIEVHFVVVHGKDGSSYVPIYYHEGDLYEDTAAVDAIMQLLPADDEKTGFSMFHAALNSFHHQVPTFDAKVDFIMGYDRRH